MLSRPLQNTGFTYRSAPDCGPGHPWPTCWHMSLPTPSHMPCITRLLPHLLIFILAVGDLQELLCVLRQMLMVVPTFANRARPGRG